jgi:hypothetical protein
MLRSGGIVLDETFRGVEFFCMVDNKHVAFASLALFPDKRLSIPQPTSTWFFFSVVVILFFNAIHGFLLYKSWGISIILCIGLKFGFYFIILWFLDKDIVVCFSSLDFTFIKLILKKLRG